MFEARFSVFFFKGKVQHVPAGLCLPQVPTSTAKHPKLVAAKLWKSKPNTGQLNRHVHCWILVNLLLFHLHFLRTHSYRHNSPLFAANCLSCPSHEFGSHALMNHWRNVFNISAVLLSGSSKSLVKLLWYSAEVRTKIIGGSPAIPSLSSTT